MTNHNSRLARLEDDGPQDQVIYVVVYDADGRAVKGSSSELIGLTREEIQTKLAGLEAQKSVLLNVVRQSDIGAVYLPDNGRDA